VLLGNRKGPGRKAAWSVVSGGSIGKAGRDGAGDVHEGVWWWEDVLDLLLLLLLLWRWWWWWWLLEMVGGRRGRLALAGGTCRGRDHGGFIA